MLTTKIQQDYTLALKNHDQKKVDVLRFLSAEIKNSEIALQRPAEEAEVVAVIRKQVKQLREAAEMFEKGGRADLATENNNQITILSQYLPAEISDEELKTRLEALKIEHAEAIKQNPKAFIGIAMGQLKSQAEPARIMKMLQEFIS